MRPSVVLSEAWRNVFTGTSRAVTLTLGVLLLAGGLAWFDAGAVAAQLVAAQEFRKAGAATHTLSAADAIDGRRCEALAAAASVTSAGALREAGQIKMAQLPSLAIPAFEATPGLLAVLGQPDARPGEWFLSERLAADLGARPGATLMTSWGEGTLAGVFAYPADGRVPVLEYAALTIVAPGGVFDACWAAFWPPEEGAALLLNASVKGNPNPEPQLTQLNSRLGTRADFAGQYLERPSRFAWVAAGWACLALTWMVTGRRRLEFATARHLGLRRRHLVGIAAVEGLLWTTPVTAALAAAAWLFASLTWPQRPWAVAAPAWWAVAAGSCGALLGNVIVAALAREATLLDSFKARA